MIRLDAAGAVEDIGRTAQPDHHLRARDRHAFSRTDVKRNALPAPGVDSEPERHESFRFGLRSDARLRSITSKLAAHHIVRSQRLDRLQDLHLLIPNRLAV